MYFEHDQRTLMLPLPKSPAVDISFTDVTLKVTTGRFVKGASLGLSQDSNTPERVDSRNICVRLTELILTM
ncbi:unnamed protein product, partial [Nesidiocoris tenuis]